MTAGKKAIPNILSCSRIAFAGLCAVALLNNRPAAAFIFLIAALLTDWADGATARKFDAVSRFGKIIDPIADKMLYFGTLAALFGYTHDSFLLWIIFLTTPPEIALTLLRILNIRGGATLAGKAKMVRQSLSLILLMLGILLTNELFFITGSAMASTAIIFSWTSLLSQVVTNEKAA